jgi:hypothetical protein
MATLQPSEASARTEASAYSEASPAGEVCETCRGLVLVQGKYKDHWQTPITMAPLLVEDSNGIVFNGDIQTQGLMSFGAQDGTDIEALREYLGRIEAEDAQRGPVTVALVAEPSAEEQARSLEQEIIADLRALAASMETSIQPWIEEWENSGWWGVLGSFLEGVKNGLTAWWEGEGEFWSAVGDWIANLPDMIGDAWDSMSESARALWENRHRIVELLQSLAEGAVDAFEQGMELLKDAVANIPGIGEIGTLLVELVENSAEWAAAMIEVATRTQVMRVLGATTVGILMLIPPNFWADIVGTASGFLIPEAIIAILFLILAAFTGGSAGAALAARLTTFAASVARRLRATGSAGRAIVRLFTVLQSLVSKLVDLVQSLFRARRERAAGTTDAEIPLRRDTTVRRAAPDRKPWYRSDLDDEWFDPDTGELRWPPNDGFDGPPVADSLEPGTRIDRYSGRAGLDDTGRYLSPEGTDFSSRALPYDPDTQIHAVYEVVEDLPVQSGQAAPWFGEAGGATQYMLDRPLNELLEEGIIRQVSP